MTPVVLVTGDFVQTGGMDRANHALAAHVAAAGRPVHLVAHRVSPDLAGRPNVTVHHVPKPLGSYALGAPLLASAGRRAARAAAAAGGRAVVNGGNCRFPDVNWVHYVHAAYRPHLPASRVRRLKQALLRPLDLRAERAAVRAARVVVCNSHATRRAVVERLGVPEGRTAVVYYGSDPARFRPAAAAERADLRTRLGWPGSRPVLLFVGALGDRRKGFDTLYAAWRGLCARPGFDAVLMAVGAGAERPLWEARAAADGLADRVRLLGFRADVPDLLRAADGLAAPTRYEAYGLGVHEAVCCGLPAVVSAAAGVAERYPPDLNDLLLPDPDDANALADRLAAWAADPGAARDRVRGFAAALRADTWDDMGRRFLAAAGMDGGQEPAPGGNPP